MTEMYIYLLVTLVVVGVLLWGVMAMPGIDPTIKAMIKVIVIVVSALWALHLLYPGFIGSPMRR